ncbi:unnamed protein product [Penicillium pancosmium]
MLPNHRLHPLAPSYPQSPSATAAPADAAQLFLAVNIIRASYDGPASLSPVPEKSANSPTPSTRDYMGSTSPNDEFWPIPESAMRPPDLQEECSRPSENSVRIQDRHSDQVSDTNNEVVKNTNDRNKYPGFAASHQSCWKKHAPKPSKTPAALKRPTKCNISSMQENLTDCHKAFEQTEEDSDMATRPYRWPAKDP